MIIRIKAWLVCDLWPWLAEHWLGKTVCCGCRLVGRTTDYDLQRAMGWCWVTQYDGEPRWLCPWCISRRAA